MISKLLEKSRIKFVRQRYPGRFINPVKCVQKMINKFGDKIAVLWSGGRCSTVVLHMAIKIKPNIKVIFNDTRVEFPETYRFISSLEKEWNLNLIRTKPLKTFWECVEEYGFPMFRAAAGSSHGEGPKCCGFLKDKPTAIALREHNIHACFLGTRAAESRVRMFVFAKRGQCYFLKGKQRWNICPIAIWTTQDLWDYETRHNIPHCKAYDKGQSRLGCWPCTGFKGWQEGLANSHPKLYNFLKERMDEKRLMEYYYDTRLVPCQGRG
jgi:phosphoadenosine phosphosulfate reductase